jgi:rhodanese-related sulfurtransferase
MKEIDVKTLKEMIDKGEDFQIIDVREQNERDFANIGGEFIPMNTVPQNVSKIATDKKVIIHCRSGKRSANIVQYLEQNHKLDNLYNLKGGILAWSDEIDPEVPKY